MHLVHRRLDVVRRWPRMATRVDELERRVAVLSRLVEVSVTLNSTLEVESLLEVIIRAAAEVIDAEAASIMLVDEHTNELRFAAATGADPKVLAQIAVPLDASIAGAVFRESRPQIVPNVRQDPRHYWTVADLVHIEVRSLLGVPMQIKGRMTGVLETLNKRGGGFTDADVDTLSVFAAQAAVAIHNARLLEKLQQAQEELRRLNQLYAVLSGVNQGIVRTRSRHELFQKVCDAAVVHGAFKLAWIGWHDLATHAVIPVAQSGDDLGYLRTIHIYADDRPEGRGPTGTSIREGRPYICNDFANDPHTTPWHEAAVTCGLRASAAIPIRLGGTVCGAFMVYADRINYFQEKEITLLEEVAADVSFGLDNLEAEAQRQRAERELHALNLELEQRVHDRTAELTAANAELEAFAYSVSHDLRAPLRHLDGFAQLLRKHRTGHLDATSTHYVNTIVEAAANMSRLIDDLLAFSRAGRVEIVKQTVRLDQLVSEVRHELLAANAGRRITWDIHALPSVNADPALLRQVLVNLLSNAVKFTAPRSEARIEIGATTNEKNETVIYVRDNGVGFDPRYAHKLFGVFQRLHSGEQFEGTGIGLANVRRVVQRHGGRVWAEGAVDQGTTFYFSLP